jgi:gamma-glutamylcyclotransferase (GGCT)/AIG2-like uncharacterized protein YtfP
LDLIWVYGTLRPRVRGSRFDLLDGAVEWLGRARVPGTLYDLGRYPGAVLEPATDRWIIGEVMRLATPSETLAALDAYEGCGPQDPLPHAFERTTGRATLDDGAAVTTWLYPYRGPLAGARLVASGDYADLADATSLNTESPRRYRS